MVGESGSGKSVSFLTVMGLISRKSAMIEGRCSSRARICCSCRTTSSARSAATKIAMIFQDPMTSLHPFYKVGDQIAEADPGARGRLQEGSGASSGRDASAGQHPQARASVPSSIRTSSRAGCGSVR